MSSHHKPRKLYIDIVVIAGVLILLAIIYFVGHNLKNKSVINSHRSYQPQVNKNLYSINDPSSIWVIINKTRPISPLNFTPQVLITPYVTQSNPNPSIPITTQPIVAQALGVLMAEAKKQNASLSLSGGYVSYNYQLNSYTGYMILHGKSAADNNVTRAGYNESQAGLSVDFGSNNKNCIMQTCFGSTNEGKWLSSNSFKYGFTLRYPNGKQNITGFSYEPWHFRYVGVSLATELYNENQNLEQFFNLPPAANYKN